MLVSVRLGAVLALSFLTGCSALARDEGGLEAGERELVGRWSWTAPGAADRQQINLYDDRTSERVHSTYSATENGKWRAKDGKLAIDADGVAEEMSVAMVPGCGAFVSGGLVFVRSEPSSTCMDSVAPLSPRERCVVGSSRLYEKREQMQGFYLYIWDRSTSFYLREDRIATRDIDTYDDGLSTYERGELTWAIEGDTLVLTNILSGQTSSTKITINRASLCFEGGCFEHAVPADCELP